MHKYFRAIGFSEPMKTRDTYNLIDDVLEKAEHRAYITDPADEDSMLTELRMDYGNGYGICHWLMWETGPPEPQSGGHRTQGSYIENVVCPKDLLK